MIILGVAIFAYFVLLALVIWKPPIALAPAVCMFGLEQTLMANSSFFTSHATYVNFAIGSIVLVGFIMSLLKGGKIAFHWPLVGWLILGIHCYYGMTFFWAYSPHWTISNLRFALPYSLTISFGLSLLFRNLEDIRTGIFATIVLAALTALFVLGMTRLAGNNRTIEYGESMQGSVYAEVMDRDRSKGGSPLAIADLGATLAVVSLLIQFPKLGKQWSLLKWGAVLLGCALVFRSGSRGQFVGLVACSIVGFKFARPKVNLQAILGIAFSVAVLFGILQFAISYFGSDTANERFDISTFSEAYRGTRVILCGNLLREWVSSSPLNLLFGLGGAASWGIQGTYPHVVVVEVLCELGIFGLSLYLLMHAVVFSKIYSLGQMTKQAPNERSVVAVLAALLLFHWMMSFKQGSLLFYHYLFCFSIVASRLEWQLRRQQRNAVRQKRMSTSALQVWHAEHSTAQL